MIVGSVCYVSPQGNDAWSGTIPEGNAAGTDGPFRTVPKATGPATVRLRAGTYRPPWSVELGSHARVGRV